MIYAFLRALQNLKNASAVEVRSSSSQPASHGFLDCLVSPVVVTSQVIFQGPEQVVIATNRRSNCYDTSLRTVLCSSVSKLENPTGTNFPISQNLHLLGRVVPHSKLRCNFSDCYPSVLSDEPIDFLLIALSCSGSRLTTARLIGDVRVSVLKMFHPPSDTADTHADVSIHITKSLVDDSCRVSPLSQEIQ
jgi:hypothetical protein